MLPFFLPSLSQSSKDQKLFLSFLASSLPPLPPWKEGRKDYMKEGRTKGRKDYMKDYMKNYTKGLFLAQGRKAYRKEGI
jgi:hypothetical protein